MKSPNAIQTTIIIPTLNEEGNIQELIERINCSMNGNSYQICIVDDGEDKTEEIAKANGVFVLKGNKQGLTQAIVKGMVYTDSDYIVVIDGDLQHPPELIPEIIKNLIDYDIVIASRYIKNGSSGEFSTVRKIISRTGNMAGILIAPTVKDKMSGYFGFKKEIINPLKLNSKGFKVLLEILANGNYQNILEIPMIFGKRKSGVSKLNGNVIFDYIKQVLRLTPKTRIVKFGIVGLSGMVIKLGIMCGLTELFGIHYTISYGTGFTLSVINNYFWNSKFTYKDRISGRKELFKYASVSSLTLAINEVIIFIMTGIIGIWYVISAIVGIGIAFLVNFFFSHKFVWQEIKKETKTEMETKNA